MQHRSWAVIGATTASLVATVLVSTPTASAASGTFNQPAPITAAHQDHQHATAEAQESFEIPDQGGASSGLPLMAPDDDAVATMIFVDVTVDHAHLDDVDLVLEAPDGRAVALASDVGGNTSGEFTLHVRYDDSPFPDGPLDDSLGLGAVDGAPVDYDTPDDLDAHPGNPPASLRPLGGALLNGPAGDVWTLHAYDDTAGDVGSVRSWGLDVYYGRPGNPSPSSLVVSGMPSNLTDVNLVLSDVDSVGGGNAEFLLENPDGRYAHVVSDAERRWSPKLDLTLDDQAAADLPEHRSSSDGQPLPAIESGAYRPRNYDDFDMAEPIAGIDTMDMDAKLSVFNGGSANGTWRLWVFQEYCCAATTIGSWSLEITTADDPPSPPKPPAPPSVTDATAPALTNVKLSPRRLPTGVGARLRVASTEAARLVGVVELKKKGEWKRVGTKHWSVRAGANTRLFYGKTAQGRLRSGAYRVLLVATDAAGNASAQVRRRFRVDRG